MPVSVYMMYWANNIFASTMLWKRVDNGQRLFFNFFKIRTNHLLNCHDNDVITVTVVVGVAVVTELNVCVGLFSAALYGILFPRQKEAAFANYRMWESLGFVIAFAYSTFLCLEYKLYILLAVLLLTVVTYPIVEYHEYKNPTPPVEEGSYLHSKKVIEADENNIINQTQM